MAPITDASISDAEKAGVRAAVFTHLAGLALAPTVGALWERGALDILTGAAGALEFAEILTRTRANAGYRRVALRLLASCGWLTEQPGADARSAYRLTTEGRI